MTERKLQETAFTFHFEQGSPTVQFGYGSKAFDIDRLTFLKLASTFCQIAAAVCTDIAEGAQQRG